MAIPLRTPGEIDRIARAGQALWRVLDDAVARLSPGVTGHAIDAFVRGRLAELGADAALARITNERGELFPGACCPNVNDSITHTPPADRALRPGDLVSLDVSLSLGGWHADACRAVVVGEASPEAAGLAGAAKAVLEAGIHACRPDRMWSQVAADMRSEASRHGVRLVPGLGGHGVGRSLHEPPLAWLDPPGPDFRLAPGLVLTLEPLVTRGDGRTNVAPDGWAVRTADGSWGACEERTVAITPAGPRVLTGPGPGQT